MDLTFATLRSSVFPRGATVGSGTELENGIWGILGHGVVGQNSRKVAVSRTLTEGKGKALCRVGRAATRQ